MQGMSMASMAVLTSVALGIIFISIKESYNNSSKMVEKSSFECGLLALNSKKMAFSTNFIAMIMLFIMFDIEIAIMMPMTMKSSNVFAEKVVPMAFLLILTMILLKEWMMGSMEWSK